MARMSPAQAASREKTLLVALLMSLWGPLMTGIAVISSQSTTQLADFIRRSVELVALAVSWWVFRKVHRDVSTTAAQARLERLASLTVAAAMLCSGAVMLALTLARTGRGQPGGDVGLGLAIAVLGLVFNSWFWRRYRGFTREQYNPVMAAQTALYRAKAYVDLAVVVALGAVAIAPADPATRYLDLLGSVIVAGYLLWNGFRGARVRRTPDQAL